MRAIMKIECKTDNVFLGFLHVMGAKYLAIKEDKPFMLSSENMTFTRRMEHLRQQLLGSLSKLDKLKPEIQAGKITIDFSPGRPDAEEHQENGGFVNFDMNGTKEEVEEWTRIGMFQKAELLTVKKWLGVKVEYPSSQSAVPSLLESPSSEAPQDSIPTPPTTG